MRRWTVSGASLRLCAAAKKAAAFLGRKARRLGETLFYAFAVAIRSFILLSWFVVLTLAS